MRKAVLSALFALSLAAQVHAQASDAGADAALPPLTGLDSGLADASVVADASARDASTDAGAKSDAGGLDAGQLDLDLPEQGCHLAHGGDLGGVVPLLLALALIRRRA